MKHEKMHIVHVNKNPKTLEVVQETLEKCLQEYNNSHTLPDRKRELEIHIKSLIEEQDAMLAQKLNTPPLRIG